MTQREFDEITRGMIAPVAAAYGFSDYENGYFKRLRGDLVDVFFLDPTRDMTNFYVQIGIHFPALRTKSAFIDGIDQPVAEISHRLGVHSTPSQANRSFGCATRAQIDRYIPIMLKEWKESALPWYERFENILAVAAEFRRARIDDPPGGWPEAADARRPDPFGWATYGWMLEQADVRDEAVAWLARAYAEVTKPLYAKGDRLVPEGTKGARRMRHSPEEERLGKLLRQSLRMPIERQQ